ncbi:unnamed protein product, partial [Discosporangium mesarthrocarpum]
GTTSVAPPGDCREGSRGGHSSKHSKGTPEQHDEGTVAATPALGSNGIDKSPERSRPHPPALALAPVPALPLPPPPASGVKDNTALGRFTFGRELEEEAVATVAAAAATVAVAGATVAVVRDEGFKLDNDGDKEEGEEDRGVGW